MHKTTVFVGVSKPVQCFTATSDYQCKPCCFIAAFCCTYVHAADCSCCRLFVLQVGATTVIAHCCTTYLSASGRQVYADPEAVHITFTIAVQGALKALLGFMYQLEHLAVLFASLNVKSSRANGPEWRKKKYARVIKLLEAVRADKHFMTDMETVTSNIWDTRNLPKLIHQTKQLSGPQLGKTQAVTVTTACDRLDVMSLYVDTAADQKREDAAGSAVDDKNTDKDSVLEDEIQDGELEEEDIATLDAEDNQEDAGSGGSGKALQLL